MVMPREECEGVGKEEVPCEHILLAAIGLIGACARSAHGERQRDISSGGSEHHIQRDLAFTTIGTWRRRSTARSIDQLQMQTAMLCRMVLIFP
jgi:hypothetical protein